MEAVLEEKPKRQRSSRKGCCSVDGCSSPIKARRLCEKHYARQLRYGTVNLRRVQIDKEKVSTCVVFGCDNPVGSRGYCSRHYSYWLKHRTPFKPKTIKLCGVQDCESKYYSKGLCYKHFNEFKQKLKAIGVEEF